MPAPTTSSPSHRPAAPLGCAILDPAQTILFSAVDLRTTSLADSCSAHPIVGPGLLSVELLQRIDFFRNFPQLALHPATYAAPLRDRLAQGADLSGTGAEDLVPGDGLLPTATCYGVLGSLSGTNLPLPATWTAVGRCFRNEDSYQGLSRLRSFHMREIIAVGSQDTVEEFRSWAIEEVNRMAADFGLQLRFEPANDPFYLPSSRALLTAIDPVKFEFLAEDGTAIASINRHRNFFGDRLDIAVDGHPAHSVCLAFGLERWVHALSLRHGTIEAALRAVAA